MAVNAISNFFNGAAPSADVNLGSALNPFGMGSNPINPHERYHDEWSHSKSKSKKGNVALSAVTLLAFLFFLHILQNCMQEHMHEMKAEQHNQQQPMINGSGGQTVIIVDEGGALARENLKGDPGQLHSNARTMKASRKVRKNVPSFIGAWESNTNEKMHRIDNIP